MEGKAPKGKRRSYKWGSLRKRILKDQPYCSLCGSRSKLEVHHIVPFHEDHSLELVESNLIVLCENKKYGINCHLLVGHLGNYRRSNEDCVKDVKAWCKKLQ